MFAVLKKHWPEYLMEAAGLGLFMVSACGFGALLEHPASPVRQAIDSAFVRRAVMGLAMGLTAIALVYSPWGKQSGAHLNPSFTLTFYRLGKLKGYDAFFYIIAQFAGGLAGVLLMSQVLGVRLAHPNVNYVVTVPGTAGIALAFVAESLITFILMSVVLLVSNHARYASRTGLCAGALIAAYITFEAPFSGMSMNPARTLGSALPAQVWTAWWIYFTAPLLGMLAAAQVYLITKGSPPRACAKLHHQNVKRCIFCGKPPG
ncbi:aquaporin family protein [candidate division KSB1 bacterium]|nr:MAG: aquaporin family protein [candidate division KSB1 bacterium]MBC6951396.1 aquaporin family protein [candidate division KSB1 bacterium]MCE7945157.1 aquaporin family protein [Chlorobi bacterium CHB1]MDL1875400.1 aquaporin family protein [Cytophagia bacterium CHB2]